MDAEFAVADWGEAERIYGITPQQALGRHGAEVLQPLDTAAISAREQALRKTGLWRGVEAFRHANGSRVLVELVVQAVRCREQVVGFIGEHWPLAVGLPAHQDAVEEVIIRKRLQIAGNSSVTGATPEPSQGPDSGLGSGVVAVTDIRESTPLEVGAKLRNAREKAKLSKRQLAHLAGVREGQLRLWERGEHRISAANLMRLIPHIGGQLEDYLFDRR